MEPVGSPLPEHNLQEEPEEDEWEEDDEMDDAPPSKRSRK